MEKKEHRSGKPLRTEPEGLDITLRNEEVKKAFKKAGCWKFCKKLQGGHAQVTKEFALNFTGLNSKVAMLELQVSPEVISAVTEIPRGQEEWFKNFKFDMNTCKEFLKDAYVNEDLSKAVPRNYVKEHYALLLTCIQKYLTCEGRYNKVYSYHFKLLLHFTGKISIDLPFYMFRSLSKMCDKVQLRKEVCETSLFHHGLIKLLVLNGLQKIDRDWNSFIFMAGFKSQTGLTPQPARDFTMAELQKEARTKKVPKSQLRKPVKPLIIQDQPQQTTKEKAHGKKTIPETSTSEIVSRVRTRSQINKEKGKAVAVEESPVSKANLNDLLQAINFEQSLPVQIELMQSEQESTKKSKASKRLRFDVPAEEFVFKPRRPMTRRFQQVQEALPRTEETGEETQKDSGKIVITAKENNIVALKSQLESAKYEIAKLKKAARKHATIHAKYYRAFWEENEAVKAQLNSVVDGHAQFHTWTVPAIKEARYIRRINMQLRAGNRAMRKQIEDLKTQLSQLPVK